MGSRSTEAQGNQCKLLVSFDRGAVDDAETSTSDPRDIRVLSAAYRSLEPRHCPINSDAYVCAVIQAPRVPLAPNDGVTHIRTLKSLQRQAPQRPAVYWA